MKKLSSNLIAIAEILSDLEYHDGNALGAKLGLTRSAIWKNIKKLESYDIEIESDKTKGYRLKNSLILLDEEKIRGGLSNPNIGLEIFETLGSTNDYTRESRSKERINICIAEHLSNARGRMGRKWHAPFGKNIYLSMGYHFKKDLSQLSGLSLVVGISLIKSLNCPGLMVKWPNDLVYEGKKVAGILIEVLAEANDHAYVIIGVGINVNMKSDQNQEITQGWDSLANIGGNYIDRNHLAASLINNLIEYLEKFKQVGLTGFTEEWSKFDGLLNKQINIQSAGELVQGVVKGINHQGNLIVEKEDGVLAYCSSGDATIIKK